MHEMSIITSVFSTIEKKIDRIDEINITAVRLNVGKFSNAIPSALEFAFDSIKKGTVFESAQLTINEIELKCLCIICNKEIIMNDYKFICPHCNGYDLKIISGRELFIDSVDIEKK